MKYLKEKKEFEKILVHTVESALDAGFVLGDLEYLELRESCLDQLIKQFQSHDRKMLEWCLKEVGTLLVVDVEQEISFLDRPLLIELKKRHNEMVVKYNNKIADVCQIIKNKMEEGK